jgi:hypothetical protein
MSSRNAVWWAMNKRRYFLPLTRWYLAQADAESATNALAPQVKTSSEQTNTVASFPAATLHAPAAPQSDDGGPRSTLPSSRFTAPLARCYYNLGLYAEWETKLRDSDLFTAREVEKSIRWDCATYSMAGRGFEVVTGYLAARAAGTVASDKELAVRFATLNPSVAASPPTTRQGAQNKQDVKKSQPKRK